MRRFAFLLLALGLVITLPQLVSAQTLARVTDATCNANSDCFNQTECQSVFFTGPFPDGLYDMTVSVNCPQGINCAACAAKACLYDLTLNQWVTSLSTNCTGCVTNTNVNIFAGHQYRLTVCKQPCSDCNTVLGCNPQCTADAKIGR